MSSSSVLSGSVILFQGRLASMARKDVTAVVRQQGGEVSDELSDSVNLVVLGEAESTLSAWMDCVEPQVRRAIESRKVELITESDLWGRLGLLEVTPGVKRWYTPAMLAELVKAPVNVVRKWRRLGLLQPVHVVHQLEYFDIAEVYSARRLVELLASGLSPEKIAADLRLLSQYLHDGDRPLSQLAVILHGKELLLRQGEGLIDKGGQYRIDFEALRAPGQDNGGSLLAVDEIDGDALHYPSFGAFPGRQLSTVEGTLYERDPDAWRKIMIEHAAHWEDEGDFLAAVEVYRAVSLAMGPDAEICFRMAEMLYLIGELAGARERYYVAIELEERFIEARASLGCVLMEMQQTALAAEAFRGALSLHPDYPDVHYHLGRCLDLLGDSSTAERHWRRFVELAPSSPWTEEAKKRLQR